EIKTRKGIVAIAGCHKSTLSFCGFVQLLVNPRHFPHPAAPLQMIERHDLLVRPVQVVGNKGYLLIQTVRGVADHSPTALISTSKRASQWGQVTPTLLCPLSLIRR